MNNFFKAVFGLAIFGSAALVNSASIHPPHKPGAGVSVESPRIELTAGEAKQVTVHFHQQGTKTPVIISLHSSQGINFAEDPQDQWRFEADDHIEVPLNIYAESDGSYSMMFRVSREMSDGIEVQSITGVAVQVGEKISQQKVSFPGGVQELPAKETVR